tara:strand:+ start:9104 stop:9523 length:420 start_codon:yes stop_codon:yes gene_type:complete
MNNILKVALIGGGAYLAYNFLQKRKNNLAVSTAGGNNSDVLIAEMEEEGEEGMAIEDTSNAEGWVNCTNPTASAPRGNQLDPCCTGTKNCRGISRSRRISRGIVGSNISKPSRGVTRNLSSKKTSSADGWDSDTISGGL